MHYANGRAAKAGDVVRGKGYNIKHEIVGLLVYANPSSSACNCQVATVTKQTAVYIGGLPVAADSSDQIGFGNSGPTSSMMVWATIEYGQLDAFVAIDPQTGEILPPEDANQSSQASPDLPKESLP